ncbi:MAG TPA: hypothetical protein DCW83_15745 [Saprospirales bacterium]|jgi:hypothetical protein|nr:hypothetical protein [Saprospirales bacterium]
MNLNLLYKSDKELNTIRYGENLSLGKEARQEQNRRKQVGYWDGSMAIQVTADNESIEVEKSTEYVYATDVKHI